MGGGGEDRIVQVRSPHIGHTPHDDAVPPRAPGPDAVPPLIQLFSTPLQGMGSSEALAQRQASDAVHASGDSPVSLALQAEILVRGISLPSKQHRMHHHHPLLQHTLVWCNRRCSRRIITGGLMGNNSLVSVLIPPPPLGTMPPFAQCRMRT